MPATLTGKRVAFVATDGVEQVELDQPWEAIQAAGATPELVSLHDGEIQAFQHHDKGATRRVDRTLDQADPGQYDALVLPGGVINGDTVRTDPKAVEFVKQFFTDGKPIGVICHGGWVLADADVVKGRKMTSWPSLQTDLRNAGANWVDERVVTDKGLVSSRKPDDLPAFSAKLVEEIGEGIHRNR
ncbi:MAG: type 1 glutamine amidotransferase [Hamadaea sp.]|nr:type 1 glutamine amidotransferase [Hamadaea sp.]